MAFQLDVLMNDVIVIAVWYDTNVFIGVSAGLCTRRNDFLCI